MKLYASVQSERAKKGQGGEYLDIDITDEKKTLLWTIKVNTYELFHKIDVWNEPDNKYWSQQITKNIDCGCEKDVFCCSKHIKGEKQKGDCECPSVDCKIHPITFA